MAFVHRIQAGQHPHVLAKSHVSIYSLYSLRFPLVLALYLPRQKMKKDRVPQHGLLQVACPHIQLNLLLHQDQLRSQVQFQQRVKSIPKHYQLFYFHDSPDIPMCSSLLVFHAASR